MREALAEVDEDGFNSTICTCTLVATLVDCGDDDDDDDDDDDV
jgi:hypothetical protein